MKKWFNQIFSVLWESWNVYIIFKGLLLYKKVNSSAFLCSFEKVNVFKVFQFFQCSENLANKTRLNLYKLSWVSMYLNVRLKIGFLLLITFILGQIAWKMTVQLLSTRVNFKTTITKQLKTLTLSVTNFINLNDWGF